MDSPTPILPAMVSSLVRSTGPGTPSSSGMVMPRFRIRLTQLVSTVGSKVRLLTTWVAYRRLSHIDWMVRSSSIVGCDSGYPVMPTCGNGRPRAARSSSMLSASGYSPGGSASPPGTKTWVMPFPLSRSQISASSARSRTIRAARCGTATYP